MFNCFLQKEANELTLIDTNFPGSGDAILRAAASFGLPITTIALTHAHSVHVGSLDVLAQALPNATIVIGEREEPPLRGNFSLDPGETGKPLLGFRLVRSSVHGALSDGDPSGSLRVVACPGHTPGHIAYLDIRDNSLIAGDSYITQKASSPPACTVSSSHARVVFLELCASRRQRRQVTGPQAQPARRRPRP